MKNILKLFVLTGFLSVLINGCSSNEYDLQEEETEVSKDNQLKKEDTKESNNEKTVTTTTETEDEKQELTDDEKLIIVEEGEADDSELIEKTDEAYKEEKANAEKKDIVYLPDFEEAVKEAEKNHPELIEKKEAKKQFNVKEEEQKEHYFSNIEDIEENYKVSFLAAIIYHSNGRNDISQNDLKALKEVVRFHKEKGGIVKIIGHASSRTRNMELIDHKIANFEMSYKRAEKIGKQLKNLGIKENNIYLGAVSDKEPVLKESMPINEAMNRRTEIYLAY